MDNRISYTQAEVYLFGSIVTATNRPQSDIAVVSREFTNDVCKNYARVNMLAHDKA